MFNVPATWYPGQSSQMSSRSGMPPQDPMRSGVFSGTGSFSAAAPPPGAAIGSGSFAAAAPPMMLQPPAMLGSGSFAGSRGGTFPAQREFLSSEYGRPSKVVQSPSFFTLAAAEGIPRSNTAVSATGPLVPGPGSGPPSPARAPTTASRAGAGSLIVNVDSALDVTPSDRFGAHHYYATAHYVGEPEEVVEARRTPSVKANASSTDPMHENCVLHERIAVPYNSRQQFVMVDIYEADQLGDTFVGQATVPLADPRLASTSPWPLIREGNQTGTVTLNIQLPDSMSSVTNGANGPSAPSLPATASRASVANTYGANPLASRHSERMTGSLSPERGGGATPMLSGLGPYPASPMRPSPMKAPPSPMSRPQPTPAPLAEPPMYGGGGLFGGLGGTGLDLAGGGGLFGSLRPNSGCFANSYMPPPTGGLLGGGKPDPHLGLGLPAPFPRRDMSGMGLPSLPSRDLSGMGLPTLPSMGRGMYGQVPGTSYSPPSSFSSSLGGGLGPGSGFHQAAPYGGMGFGMRSPGGFPYYGY